MSTPFIGEIRMFAGNFPPNGWMFCQGQLMPISENDALFTLIGTTYGGDGQETFALPNLASRVPLHMGTGPDGTTYQLGEAAGTEQETLSTNQMPVHNHPVMATSTGQTLSPANATFAVATSSQAGVLTYSQAAVGTTLAPGTVGPSGGSQPHENTQPFLVLNFIISLFGIYPQPT